jgi:amino acid transporter
MGYLIGLLGLGSIVLGLLGVGFGNRALVIIGTVMLLACLILCVLDVFMASSKGAKGNPPFNWVIPFRLPHKRRTI